RDAGGDERAARCAVARVLDPRLFTGIEEGLGDEVDRLLRAADDQDLRRVAADPARRGEVAGDRLTERAVALEIMVAEDVQRAAGGGAGGGGGGRAGGWGGGGAGGGGGGGGAGGAARGRGGGAAGGGGGGGGAGRQGGGVPRGGGVGGPVAREPPADHPSSDP